MESSEADLLAPRFQRKRLKTEQIGRVSKRFIWSNLCTRHIPKQLTPHGYGDWPDKRATRIEIPLMTTCRTKNDKRLICCDPAGLLRAALTRTIPPAARETAFWEIETPGPRAWRFRARRRRRGTDDSVFLLRTDLPLKIRPLVDTSLSQFHVLDPEARRAACSSTKWMQVANHAGKRTAGPNPATAGFAAVGRVSGANSSYPKRESQISEINFPSP